MKYTVIILAEADPGRAQEEIFKESREHVDPDKLKDAVHQAVNGVPKVRVRKKGEAKADG